MGIIINDMRHYISCGYPDSPPEGQCLSVGGRLSRDVIDETALEAVHSSFPVPIISKRVSTDCAEINTYREKRLTSHTRPSRVKGSICESKRSNTDIPKMKLQLLIS